MKASNVINDDGLPRMPTIGEMQPGDQGFTVPWAYDKASGVLDENYTLNPSSSGTSEMLVVCVNDGMYEIDFYAVRHRHGQPNWQK